MDQDFVALNIKLGQTLLPYGNETNRKAIKKKQSRSESLADTVIADRLTYNNRLNKIIQTKGDLIDDIESGLVILESLTEDELPEVLRGKTLEEKQSFVNTLSNERKEYKRIISNLIVERKEYIQLKTKGTDASFDKEVIESIKALAQKKGLVLK